MSQLDPKLPSLKTILFGSVWKILGSSVTLGSFLTLAVGSYGNVEELFGDLSWRYKKLADSLIKAKPYFIDHVGFDSNYVSRSKLESRVSSVYENTVNTNGRYFVMYGPKGAGKSSLVARALAEKYGVIEICISQGDTVDTIIQEIFRSCQLKPDSSATLKSINRVLRDAASKRQLTVPDPTRPGTNMTVNHPLTLVFEVERGSSSADVLSLIKHVAKQFAIDSNVLINLSEANAVLGFGDDKRQSFIFVDEMTYDEALELTKKIYPTISKEDFDKFAEAVGTLPLDVVNFAQALCMPRSSATIDYYPGQSDTETVDRFIGEAVKFADGDLVAFLHKPILAALKASPEGVMTKIFDSVEDKEVLLSAPKDVALAMKKVNAILYHFETQEYRLFSKSHKTAMKKYDPVASKK